MRTFSISAVLLSPIALLTLALGQAGLQYHTGKLLQMESVQCVVESQASVGGAFKTCQEYVLQGEGVLFHLHAKNVAQALLPVGKNLPYRIEEGRFFLRLNGHDREFAVVAMEPLESTPAPVHSAEKINHLQ